MTLVHAMSVLEKSIQLDPTNASAHYRLATLYRKKGRAADATTQLEDYQRLYQLRKKLDTLYREMRLQQLHQSDDKDIK